MFLSTTAKATLLIRTVDSDRACKWANNTDIVGEIITALSLLNAKVTLLEIEMVLHQEQSDLRKNFGKEHLLVKLEAFLELDKPIKDVENAHARIWRMHQSRSGSGGK